MRRIADLVAGPLLETNQHAKPGFNLISLPESLPPANLGLILSISVLQTRSKRLKATVMASQGFVEKGKQPFKAQAIRFFSSWTTCSSTASVCYNSCSPIAQSENVMAAACSICIVYIIAQSLVLTKCHCRSTRTTKSVKIGLLPGIHRQRIECDS